METPYDYDLIVIGSGPAGEKGAAQAAYFGMKVAVIERADHVGGAGINTGTVPSKTLRETALYYSGLRQRGLYGIDYSIKENLNIRNFMYREQAVVETEWQTISANLERHKITTIWGSASFKDAHTICINLRDGGEIDLTASIVLIATGSSPYHPPELPFDNEHIYDSDSILQMERIPKSMAIIGGGVIGTEYAGIFSALGVDVALVDSRERMLPFTDSEIANRLRVYLERLGLRFVFNTRVAKTGLTSTGVRITLSTGESLAAETALFAAGRQSNIEGLGLEAVGITPGKRGLIQVNDKYQTSVPNIYAAGDVIGFPALASTSMEQARVAMVHAFDLHYKERLSPVIPLAVYTIPEISMVGLTEDECMQKEIPYLVGRAFYAANARGQIIGDTDGMVKLIFSPAGKKLLGVHLIGEMASELIHLGAHVMADGGTIDAFIDAVYNFPTLSELYKYAAYDGLGRWNLLADNAKVKHVSVSSFSR
jgi:NAD(P) transhydrogenase